MMTSTRCCVVLLSVLVFLSLYPSVGSAQSSEKAPCIILVQPEETYIIGLSSVDSDSEYSVILCFDHTQSVATRLAVQEPYIVVCDFLANNIYYIRNGTFSLCTVKYVGLEHVLLGEERARLEITSESYLVYLVGIHSEESSIELDIPESFRIIVALCSLVPFFLLVPDAIEELQIQLDAEAMSKSVYGQILALLLPLLSIGLTFLLLGGLDVFT